MWEVLCLSHIIIRVQGFRFEAVKMFGKWLPSIDTLPKMRVQQFIHD